MKCLMIASGFSLPYHVLRTAAAAGHQVHVLGSGSSRGLRWSRYCASYRPSRGNWLDAHADLIRDEIAETVRALGLKLILPSDDISTRLVAALRDGLPAPTSLVPDVATFDLLNDKWSFTRFCLEHGVRVPQGWLFQDAEALRTGLARQDLQLPITVKPLSCSASFGVVHLRDAADMRLLETVDYRPVLVQRHIHGETIGFNVICRDGEILAHAAQRRDLHRFELIAEPDLRQNVERLVAMTRYTGPANFDAVVEDGSGLSYIVECNPRFWYTIYMSMIVGMNFVDLAIRRRRSLAPPSGRVRLSMREILRRPGRATASDWHMVGYKLGDPLPFVFQRQRMFRDDHGHLRPGPTVACPMGAALQSAPSGTAELVS